MDPPKERYISRMHRYESTVNDGAATPAGDPGATSLRDRVRQATKELESEIILAALHQNRWSRRRTAEALRISYRSLMYKMKNCGIRNYDEPAALMAGSQSDGARRLSTPPAADTELAPGAPLPD